MPPRLTPVMPHVLRIDFRPRGQQVHGTSHVEHPLRERLDEQGRPVGHHARPFGRAALAVIGELEHDRGDAVGGQGRAHHARQFEIAAQDVHANHGRPLGTCRGKILGQIVLGRNGVVLRQVRRHRRGIGHLPDIVGVLGLLRSYAIVERLPIERFGNVADFRRGRFACPRQVREQKASDQDAAGKDCQPSLQGQVTHGFLPERFLLAPI